MPYIEPDVRDVVLSAEIGQAAFHDPGDLTFALTQLVLGFLGDKPRFRDYAAALGALEATKLELYRRAVAPYEDAKKEANGDVYD